MFKGNTGISREALVWMFGEGCVDLVEEYKDVIVYCNDAQYVYKYIKSLGREWSYKFRDELEEDDYFRSDVHSEEFYMSEMVCRLMQGMRDEAESLALEVIEEEEKKQEAGEVGNV